jgi:large subunit ribosomal protein L18
MKESQDRKAARFYRHMRVRKKVNGTADRPRMAVSVSNRYMYVQFVDDLSGATLASVTSMSIEGPRNVETARKLGQAVAALARERGITRAVVDRGGFRFHGRIKALVEAAVEGGLSIKSKEAK